MNQERQFRIYEYPEGDIFSDGYRFVAQELTPEGSWVSLREFGAKVTDRFNSLASAKAYIHKIINPPKPIIHPYRDQDFGRDPRL